jgi:hypothetical protein
MTIKKSPEQLGVLFPKKISISADSPEWTQFSFIFQQELTDIMEFSVKNYRESSGEASAGGSVGVIFCGWNAYKSYLFENGTPNGQADKMLMELVHSLFQLTKIYSEPKKPPGIGSKTKDSNYSDEIFPSLNCLSSDLIALESAFQRTHWVPAITKLELKKTQNKVDDIKKILEALLVYSKERSYYEYIQYRNLVWVFNDDIKIAEKVVNDFIAALKRNNVPIFKGAEKWKQRLKGMDKKLKVFLDLKSLKKN